MENGTKRIFCSRENLLKIISTCLIVHLKFIVFLLVSYLRCKWERTPGGRRTTWRRSPRTSTSTGCWGLTWGGSSLCWSSRCGWLASSCSWSEGRVRKWIVRVCEYIPVAMRSIVKGVTRWGMIHAAAVARKSAPEILKWNKWLISFNENFIRPKLVQNILSIF